VHPWVDPQNEPISPWYYLWFFLFSRPGFDEGWNARTEKRVSIHTELHTRSSSLNDHSANHVTHHCFDMQKGGASSHWAGLYLKGQLRR